MNRPLSKLVFLSLVVMLSFSEVMLSHRIFAQEKLTLTDCLHLAFQHSRLLKSAEISAMIADQVLAESKRQRLPSINLISMYTRIGKITSFSIPMGPSGETRKLQFGTPNRITLDLKLQLPVFTWGRIERTISLSYVGRKLSRIQLNQQKINLTDQVLRGYYAVLLNQEVVRLHKVSVVRARNHLNVAKKRYESGVVPRLEMMRAEVQLKNTETDLNEALGNLEKSKIFLAKLVGKPAESIFLADSIQFKKAVFDEKEIVKGVLEIKSDLRTLKLRQQMLQDQIGLAKSGNKPNLFLFSGYNVTNGFDPMDPDKFIDNYNVGVQLAFPLFDGFATSHKIQQAKLNYQNARLQEEEIRELLRMQIRQFFISLKQAEEKIHAQKENIVLAKKTLETADRQYNEGLVSSLDVLDAQQVLSRSELIYTQAIFNHIMTKLDICKAIEDYSWFETVFE